MKYFNLLLFSSLLFSFSVFGQLQDDFHQKLLTLDSHTDTPLMLGNEGFNFGIRNNPDNGGGRVDLVRMTEGGLDAVFFAVFTSQGIRTEEGNFKAKERAFKIFDNIDATVKANEANISLSTSSADARRNSILGKKSIFIGIENGYPIGNDLSLIETFYEKGARYITLCHSKNNDICDSSTDSTEHHGLSKFGEEVVNEMNRLGIMIDVSHISDEAFFDVLKLTKVPVIASHSNARAICSHPRNLTDSMLFELKKNGGVVQVCVLSAYVKKQAPNPEKEKAIEALRMKYNNFNDLTTEQEKLAGNEWRAIEKQYKGKLASVSDLVDHIDHIVQLIGIDHVGFGSDFDGGGGLSDCKDVSQLANITNELLKRGYSADDIQKFWSGNFLRVFEQVENFKTN
jgi:membrane dipeptidase